MKTVYATVAIVAACHASRQSPALRQDDERPVGIVEAFEHLNNTFALGMMHSIVESMSGNNANPKRNVMLHAALNVFCQHENFAEFDAEFAQGLKNLGAKGDDFFEAVDAVDISPIHNLIGCKSKLTQHVLAYVVEATKESKINPFDASKVTVALLGNGDLAGVNAWSFFKPSVPIPPALIVDQVYRNSSHVSELLRLVNDDAKALALSFPYPSVKREIVSAMISKFKLYSKCQRVQNEVKSTLPILYAANSIATEMPIQQILEQRVALRNDIQGTLRSLAKFGATGHTTMTEQILVCAVNTASNMQVYNSQSTVGKLLEFAFVSTEDVNWSLPVGDSTLLSAITQLSTKEVMAKYGYNGFQKESEVYFVFLHALEAKEFLGHLDVATEDAMKIAECAALMRSDMNPTDMQSPLIPVVCTPPFFKDTLKLKTQSDAYAKMQSSINTDSALREQMLFSAVTFANADCWQEVFYVSDHDSQNIADFTRQHESRLIGQLNVMKAKLDKAGRYHKSIRYQLGVFCGYIAQTNPELRHKLPEFNESGDNGTFVRRDIATLHDRYPIYVRTQNQGKTEKPRVTGHTVVTRPQKKQSAIVRSRGYFVTLIIILLATPFLVMLCVYVILRKANQRRLAYTDPAPAEGPNMDEEPPAYTTDDQQWMSDKTADASSVPPAYPAIENGVSAPLYEKS